MLALPAKPVSLPERLFHHRCGIDEYLHIATGAGNQEAGQFLRVYAHCSRNGGTGNVSFAFVNIASTTTFELRLGLSGTRSEYHFAPAGGDLLSRDVELNGAVLALDGDEVPAYTPIATAADEPVRVAPLSYGFVEVDRALPTLCRSPAPRQG